MCTDLFYKDIRHCAGNVPIELPRPVPADTWIGNVVRNLLRKIGDPLPCRLQRLIGSLILDIQVTSGGWPLSSSTFDQIAPVFLDVDVKCLVHILNRPFQDQRPILHVDSFNASFLVLSASVSRNEPTTSNKYSDLQITTLTVHSSEIGNRRKLKTKLTSPSDHKCARHVGKIHSVLVKGTKVNAYPDLYIDAAISSSSTALSTQRCSAIHAARSVFPFLEISSTFPVSM